LRSALAYTSTFLAVTAVLVGGMVAPEVAPLSDLPNHLARAHVLAHLDEPAYAAVWRADWGAYPNLAFDLFARLASGFLSATTATRTFLALTVIVWCWGCVSFGAAVSGRRSLRALFACTFVWNAHLLQGYVNFVFGMGLALHVLAAVVERRRRAPELAAIALGSLAVGVSHAAATISLLVIGGALLVRSLHGQPLRERLPSVLAATIPAGAYFAAWLLRHGGASGERSFSTLGHSTKHLLFSTLPTLSGRGDVVVVAVCALAFGTVSLRHRRSGTATPLALAAVVLTALVFVAPSDVAGAYDSNGRYALGAWLCALFAPNLREAGGTLFDRAIAGGTALVLGARTVALASSLFAISSELSAARAVLTAFPERARLGNLTWFEKRQHAVELRQRMLLHVTALAVVDRQADVPTLYTIPAVQPLARLTPAFDLHRFWAGDVSLDVARVRRELDGAWICRAPTPVADALRVDATSLGESGGCELLVWRR
jgi:hypothetical protein